MNGIDLKNLRHLQQIQNVLSFIKITFSKEGDKMGSHDYAKIVDEFEEWLDRINIFLQKNPEIYKDISKDDIFYFIHFKFKVIKRKHLF